MQKIEAWRTSDGAIFTDARTANRHAEERFGAALTALAHEAVRISKYMAMSEFIESNLARFVELSRLSDDRKLSPDEVE